MVKFRTKARAVDHLGKGQIADLPTAICELWKNGYDAYADNVWCNLFQEGFKNLDHSLFTLSDDGCGMSYEDILHRWVVLGTDSKARGIISSLGEDRLGKAPRVPLGEKGIGRLSVSYLGTPMLLLTKKKGGPAHMLFADWRILENFSLYLEEIDFPIAQLGELSEIDDENEDDFNSIFDLIIESFKDNFKNTDWEEHLELKQAINDSLDAIKVPEFMYENEISDFYQEDYHGTTFIIFNPHSQLESLSIDGSAWGSETDNTLNYLRSSLNGITNVFQEKNEPKIKSHFNIHNDMGYYEIISKMEFFSRDDMFSVDHWLSGSFNEYGEFEGKLKVFNQVHEVFFRPNRPPGKTPYGPFPIEFGFVEGSSANSKLPQEQWDQYKKKLDVYGGLYLYRDGFRVLPYGRAEHDFLRFEERRSKGASYYQFSHRRFVGYISLTREFNPALKDKAGREGFIVNRAYKEFGEDLIEFFVDLSVRYFRTVGKNEEPTSREIQVKEINARNKRIVKAEKDKNKNTQKQFKNNLKNNLSEVQLLEVETKSLYNQIKLEASKPKIIYNEVQNLIEAIKENKVRLKDLNLVKPARFILTKSLKAKYSEYREKIELSKEIVTACNALINDLQVHFSPENMETEFVNRLELYKDSIRSKLEGYKKKINKALDPLKNEIRNDLSSVPGEFIHETGQINRSNEINLVERSVDDYPRILTNLDNLFDEYTDDIDKRYGPITTHLEGLDLNIDDDALVGWYKDQYEKISEKVEAMHELAQLGMAIEIIDHQFNVLYAEMDQSITFFKQVAINDYNAKEPYNQLRTAFEHLETNHKLLTPLYRTTRRTRVEITGLELKEYLEKFFETRFQRHRIDFNTDEVFDNYVFYTFESVIKPVFINIINNSLYWLRSDTDRKIRIKYENGTILLYNSGPKIGREFLEDVFKLFFSRRPGGRGIGLYLAQTNLRTIGYDIYASEDKKLNKLNGACFVIVTPEDSDNDF